MRTISFSEARNRLKQVIDQVVDDADVAIITRRDAPDAVVMSEVSSLTHQARWRVPVAS